MRRSDVELSTPRRRIRLERIPALAQAVPSKFVMVSACMKPTIEMDEKPPDLFGFLDLLGVPENDDRDRLIWLTT